MRHFRGIFPLHQRMHKIIEAVALIASASFFAWFYISLITFQLDIPQKIAYDIHNSGICALCKYCKLEPYLTTAFSIAAYIRMEDLNAKITTN